MLPPYCCNWPAIRRVEYIDSILFSAELVFYRYLCYNVCPMDTPANPDIVSNSIYVALGSAHGAEIKAADFMGGQISVDRPEDLTIPDMNSVVLTALGHENHQSAELLGTTTYDQENRLKRVRDHLLLRHALVPRIIAECVDRGYMVIGKAAQPPPADMHPQRIKAWDSIVAGESTKGSSRTMFISPNTVKTLRAGLYEDLGVDTSSAAALYYWMLHPDKLDESRYLDQAACAAAGLRRIPLGVSHD